MNVCDNMTARQRVSGPMPCLTKAANGVLTVDQQPISPKGDASQVQCRVCDEIKPCEDFYPRQVRKCGTVGECKDCTRARVKRRAQTNPMVQEYDRQRAKTPKRAALRAKIGKRWREENAVAYAAQTAVGNAIRDGRLKRDPCLFCGAGEVHAHHRDYTKPLEVIWLCPKCHHRLHANFPEAEGLHKQAAPF